MCDTEQRTGRLGRVVSRLAVVLATAAVIMVGGWLIAAPTASAQVDEITIDKTVLGSGETGDFTFDIVGTSDGFVDDCSTALGVPLEDFPISVTAVDIEDNLCSYTVTELPAVGCTLVGSNGVVVGEDGDGTARFTNVCPGEVPLTINKVIEGTGTGEVESTFLFLVTSGGGCVISTSVNIDSFDLSETVLVADVDDSGEPCLYRIEEGFSDGCVSLTEPMEDVAVGAAGATVEFRNRCEAITIVKTVLGSGPLSDSFDFTVTSDVINCLASNSGPQISGAGQLVVDVDAVGDAPCTYTVAETNPGDCVSLTAPIENVDPGATVEFINVCPGMVDLRINKTVVGSGVPGEDFFFDITDVNGGVTGCTIVGEATIAAGGPGTTSVLVGVVDVDDFGVQCEYEVTEREVAGCTLVAGPIDPIQLGGTASFTNLCPNTADITINKLVLGSGEPTADFEFVLESDSFGCSTIPAMIPFGVAETMTVTVSVVDIDGTGGPCTYRVRETESGSCTPLDAGPLPVDLGGSVDFSNVCPGIVQLTIDKTVLGSGTPAGDFEFVIRSNATGCTAEAEATIDGQDVTTVDVVDVDSSGVPCMYIVSETGDGGCALVPTAEAPVAANATVAFTNLCADEAMIMIDKTVIGSGEPTSDFMFGVRGDGTGCTDVTTTLSGEGTATVTVSDIDDTGEPCSYTVAEIETGGCRLLNGEPLVVAPGGSADFTNVCGGDSTIEIEKSVSGDGAPERDFEFTVRGNADGCTSEATATISGAGTVAVPVADVDPDGEPCMYMVSETDAGGCIASGGDTEAIAAGGRAIFLNTCNAPITCPTPPVAPTPQPVATAASDEPSPVDPQPLSIVCPTIREISIIKTVVGNGSPTSDFQFTARSNIEGCTAEATGFISGAGTTTIAVIDFHGDTYTPCRYQVGETANGGCRLSEGQEATVVVEVGDSVSFENRCQIPRGFSVVLPLAVEPRDRADQERAEQESAEGDRPGRAGATGQRGGGLAVTGAEPAELGALAVALVGFGAYSMGVGRIRRRDQR